MDKPHSRDLRKGRHSQPGHIYLLTAKTGARQPLFLDPRLACVVIHAFREESRTGSAVTLAFVVMPDHFHWLVQLQQGDISALMRRVKGRSAVAIARTLPCLPARGRIWQDGFHDHALRREESLLNAARYVVANPLRAGLCQHIGDYPHWDAAWLHGKEFL